MNAEHLSPKQAAELIGCHVDLILAAIRRGDLIASDVSSCPGSGRATWRFTRADFDRFLESRRPSPPPKPRRRERQERVPDYLSLGV